MSKSIFKVVCYDMNGLILEPGDAIMCVINEHKYKAYIHKLIDNNQIEVGGEYDGIIDAADTYFCP